MPIQEAGDRQIISGHHAGSVFPREERTTSYSVRLDGTRQPFDVEGAIYARELQAQGIGVVYGPVLARGDVTLQNTGTGLQRYLGGLSTRGNLSATTERGALADSLTARADRAAFVIRGEVIAQNVTLQNAVVFGNIRAKRVVLESCVVMGAVIADELAEIKASAFTTFDSGAVSLLGPCTCFMASGTSRAPLVFGPFEDGKGQSHNFSLRHLALCRSQAVGCGFGRAQGGKYVANQTVACSANVAKGPNVPAACKYSGVRLGPGDFVRAEATRTVTRIEGGRPVSSEQPLSLFVLSIAGRALNLRAISHDAEQVRSVLRGVLEFDHYDEKSQQAAMANWKQNLSPDELALLDLALATAPARGAAAHGAGAAAKAVPA